MIGTDFKLDRFISANKWAVLTTLRKDGMPASTWVAYARDGDTLIVTTAGKTFKRKSLERDPRVTVCCSSENAPFTFVTIEGRATVEKDNLFANTKRIFAVLGESYKEPENLQQWLEDQDRVILRIHPEKVYGVVRE